MAVGTKNLATLLEGALPVALRHIPQRIHNVAEELDLRVALVGGLPRDLLRIGFKQLERDAFAAEVRDFDITVQGDGIRFAYELARRLPGKLVVNEAFLTANLTTSDPVSIDIASARREIYPTPGLLPEVDVEGVALEEDLQRRDFTLGAIAIEMGEHYGALLDVTGGSGDIRSRMVRALHERSFFEDPTRLFRAMRYCMRLNYEFEPTTQAQMLQAIHEGNVDCLSPERVRYELECIGREDCWSEVWQMLDFTGLTGILQPALEGLNRGWLTSDARALDIALRHREELLEENQLPAWLIRTAWALGGVQSEELEAVCQRIGLFPRYTVWIRRSRYLLRECAEAPVASMPPSMLCSILEKHPRQAVVIAAFILQPRSNEEVEIRKALLRYLEEYSQVRSELSAEELMKMGLTPGPAFGQMRTRLRYMRVDGIINSKAEEAAVVQTHLEGLAAQSKEE